MKFNSTIVVAALAALTLAAPACESEKKDDKKEDKKKDGKKEEAKKAQDAPEEPPAPAVQEEPAVDPAADPAAVPADGSAEAPAAEVKTGIAECDELYKRSMCTFDKIPDATAQEQARKAFTDSAADWQKQASDEATKATAQEACKAALETGSSSFEAVGC